MTTILVVAAVTGWFGALWQYVENRDERRDRRLAQRHAENLARVNEQLRRDLDMRYPRRAS